MRIIHCITDEKFVENIITTFEFLGDRCDNRYVHVTDKKKNYRFLEKFEKIEYLSTSRLENELFTNSCDVIFLHNLQSMPYKSISKIPQRIKVVWLAWGFDLYGHLASKPFIQIPHIIQPETKRLLWTAWDKQLIEQVKIFLKNSRNQIIKKAVERIDFFSGVIPEEYDMMCDVPFFHARRIDYRYASPVSDITMSLVQTKSPVNGKNILIGNSGDPSNNHADIFKKLSCLNLSGRLIYVPLSYGENPRYIEKIKAIGTKMWGDNFVALEKFMPSDEYKSVISSCGFRFFGHERQQAMGNIYLALMDGCKVFLSETSVLWKHLSQMGVKLYSIQNEVNQECLTNLMDAEETKSNRRIVIEDLLTSTHRERLYNMIDFLKKEIEQC